MILWKQISRETQFKAFSNITCIHIDCMLLLMNMKSNRFRIRMHHYFFNLMAFTSVAGNRMQSR